MALVKVDAKSLEWKVAVMLSMDKVGIEEILAGADVHSVNKEYFRLPDRHTAKIYLFRTIYKGSGWSFAHDPAFMHVSSDPSYWDAVNGNFYFKYAGLNATHEAWAKLVAERKPIISPLGRVWKLEPVVNNWGKSQIPWTTLSNYPVQGTGHDIVSVARILLRNKMLQHKLTARLITTVHDDIMADVPEKEVKTVAALMYESFDEVRAVIKQKFNYDTVIPFEGEVKTGQNMADMQDLPLKELK